jgi:antitoxin MazE
VEIILQVQVARWGNSLGVRIPKDIAAAAGLSAGDKVEMLAEDHRIVMSVAKPRYRLDEMLAGMTPAAMRDVFDWGEDVGREHVAA